MKSIVVTPTYNERDNIQSFIEEILKVSPECHVCIVDDRSPDGTGQLVEELSKNDGRVHVIHRTGERGRGLADFDGIRFAVENNFDFIISMDADFSHQPFLFQSF
ncbi:MAG: glycosyltransferase [Candidatus Omnitrophota bacterium]